MADSYTGALVKYCGHRAVFVADIVRVGNANVVRANRPVTMENVVRDPSHIRVATHHLGDFPTSGFWRPDLGVFVVPEDQVVEL